MYIMLLLLTFSVFVLYSSTYINSYLKCNNYTQKVHSFINFATQIISFQFC